MKTNWFLAAALCVFCTASFGCDEKGAFGFEFGQPVPKEAGKPKGGSVSNAMVTFEGSVPQPMAGFDRYGFDANKDRKFVFGIEASRLFFSDEGMAPDQVQPAWTAALEKIRVEILGLKKAWEEKYGFEFKKDFTHDFSWTAETPTVTAQIRVDYHRLVIRCTNRALESKAMQAAMKSM